MIRSRFPIFTDATSGKMQGTVHVMMSNACPYHRNFCSEPARSQALPQDRRRRRTGVNTSGTEPSLVL